LINEVLISFKPRFDAEKAQLIILLPDEEIKLNIDRLHLQGVMVNLIDNSLKYSKPPVQIEINLVHSADFITLAIADRGIGIPLEYHSRIFGKFFRVPTGETHDVKGYGLGLSYAKLVIEQHGGTIKYSERPGGGSIFEFSLPVSNL
jgi:two-component system phosphate regulon sensor histidine kinase PhoR